MSLADISPASVLKHIRAGKRKTADLAEVFEVLPSSVYLHDAIGTLIAHHDIRRLPNGDLIPHDLLETLEDQ